MAPEACPMTTAPPIIETRGLTKRFGSRTAVSDLNLTVPPGTAFGFLGHNGAGKTTVIRMLVSLTRPPPAPSGSPASPSPATASRCWPGSGPSLKNPAFTGISPAGRTYG